MPRGHRNPNKERVEFNGVSYSRYPGERYYWANRWDSVAKRYRSESLHRAVWKHHFGPIPDGCHIHHKDKDWNNNDISNLECLTPKEHGAQHSDEMRRTPEQMASTFAALGKWWEGVKYRKVECVQCGKKFKSRHPDIKRVRFCSRLCQERHINGDRPKTCQVCGARYMGRPSSYTCSERCSEVRCSKRCQQCGGEIVLKKMAYTRPRKYCSKPCASAARRSGL